MEMGGIREKLQALAQRNEDMREGWVCPDCGSDNYNVYGNRPTKCDNCVAESKRRAVQDRIDNPAKMLSESTVPKVLHGARLSQLQSTVKDAVLRWCDEGGFLTFVGPVGSGKSWAACVAAQRVLALYDHQSDWYDTIEHFMWEKSQSFIRAMKNFETSHQYFNTLAKCKYLAIDDFGAERSTEFSGDSIMDLISERYDWMRPTIITTNLQPDDISSSQPRVGSRILSGIVVSMSGEDRRLGK